MKYTDLLKAHEKCGTTKMDILKMDSFNDILENVVIAPWWNVDIFKKDNIEIKQINEKLYNITGDNFAFSFLQLKAIGAPVSLDIVLKLGLSKCKKIIFIGSVGSLSEDIKIGDIVIPNASVCGDGASRYLNNDLSDDFGKSLYPNLAFQKYVTDIASSICVSNNINFHIEKNFSTDSIFAQFAHIDYIKLLNCKTIEMETASVFKAAELIGIPAVALLCVSDNTVTKKSLYSGRTKEERTYRHSVREKIIPLIIEECFSNNID